jgi:hypothetical protein
VLLLQVVVDRIFARMVACAGIPMAAGIVLLFVFYYLKKQGGDDFPVWPAYVSQAVTLLGGLGGECNCCSRYHQRSLYLVGCV